MQRRNSSCEPESGRGIEAQQILQTSILDTVWTVVHCHGSLDWFTLPTSATQLDLTQQISMGCNFALAVHRESLRKLREPADNTHWLGMRTDLASKIESHTTSDSVWGLESHSSGKLIIIL